MESVDCVVIGAGVVGLAVSRRLAMAGREVIVLEAEGIVGSHTSSRNSEVIHAGIYYPSGSRKARVCVEGRRALYRYCEEHGVPYANVGKLIVATEESEVHAAPGPPGQGGGERGGRPSPLSVAMRSNAWNPRCERSRASSRRPPGLWTATGSCTPTKATPRTRGR